MHLTKFRRLSKILILSLALTSLPAYGADTKAGQPANPAAEPIAVTDSLNQTGPNTPTDPGTDTQTEVTEPPIDPETPVDPEIPPLPPEKLVQTITCGTSYGVKFGETKQVNAKADGGGMITFTSNHPEIFEVTETGLLIPKKMGSGTLTVTASETETHKAAVKQVKITVKTSLAKPNVTTREVKNDTMSLKWDRITGAVKYEIYRKVSGSPLDYALVETITNPNTVSYSDPAIEQGTLYYYKVRAVAANENDYNDSLGRSLVWLAQPEAGIGTNAHRVQLNWKKIKGASGYIVYRKLSTESAWQQLTKITNSSLTSYHDSTCKNDKTYEYQVKAYYGDSESTLSKTAQAYYFAAPTGVDFAVADKNSRRLTWTKNTAADGYEVQYANNRLFISAVTMTVPATATEKIISNLSYKKTYFARVRAFKTRNGEKIYSSWQECKRSGTAGYAVTKRIENKDKPLELRGVSGQTMYRNDTAQGGCTDGTYAYYCMYDRARENAKVVKIRLSDNKLIKASGVLPIDHGNSITYNSKTGRLVVTYTSNHIKRMAVIHPETLTLERSFDVKFADDLNGKFFSSDKDMGFSSISYNAARDVYVTVTKGTRGFAILDNNFKIKEYIPFSKRDEGYLWQNVDSTDEYITVVKSPMAGSGRKNNILSIYDWDGRFVTDFNLSSQMELENVFHIGTKYYLTLYKAYYDRTGKYCRDSYVYTFDFAEENLTLRNCAVIPSKPYKLTLTNGKKQIKLKWTEISNADGYKIYYKTSKNGTYKLLKTIYGSRGNTYTHKYLKPGRTYYYKVRAFNKTDGKYYYSPYTTVKYMKAKSK